MHAAMARTIYRIQERLLGRRSFAYLRELDRTEHLDRDALQAIQLRRLKDLVRIGYQHTAYWREVMDREGFGPGDIRTLDDLARFPLLVKSTLRERR
ncbi:MAG: phenylacetate--CoA ligase family protein, partial [Planctomycetota bacterium]